MKRTATNVFQVYWVSTIAIIILHLFIFELELGVGERQKIWMKRNECKLSFDDIAHLYYVENNSFILGDDKKGTATEKQELLALSTKSIILYEMN